MPVNLRQLIVWSIIGTGISSVTTQILTIREFLTQFQGNEITISLVLFSWLLLTGLGSLAAKTIKRPSPRIYTLLTFAIAIGPLIQILAIRGFREPLITHGSSPGFYAILIYIVITIAPYCVLTGFILPFAQKVLNDNNYDFESGQVYITDNIGDILGGVLFSFVLVYLLKPFSTIAITSAPLFLVVFLFLRRFRSYFLLLTALVLTSLFYTYALDRSFEKQSLSTQYGDIIHYSESPYGRIVVSKEGPQHTFWESGTPLYSDANIINSEEKIHYPLSQLDKTGNVLLISGGLGETLDEISKYNPTHVDYVELDPYLTDAALELGVIKKSPFLDIINIDGRRHIKMTKKRYDAIIIDLPDPDTFQINRFFTREFFSAAKKVLKKDGVFSVGLGYSQNYLSDIRKKKLSTLYNTARLYFKNVRFLPGQKAYLICRDGELSSDIPARLKSKSIKTSYIEGFFYGNVTQERIKRLKDSLDPNEEINTDFEPRLTNTVFQEWFTKHNTSPRLFIVILFVLTVIYMVFLRREEYILFSTGLTTMGVEMLIIFSFQVVYGYIYLQIGAIITAFLLGLLPGAIAGKTWKLRNRSKLIFSEALLLSILLLFYVWVAYFRNELHPFFFLGFCFLFSFLCGFQFPVVTNTIGEERSPVAGCLAADLCGASVGTLATGAILIPFWGIKSAVIFLILVKISSTIVTLFSGKKTA
jgi:spermidine synthase